MNVEQLTEKYGARYPYTKKPLPPCLTVDGVEFELGMTLWWLEHGYDEEDTLVWRPSYKTDPSQHDIFLERFGGRLQWFVCQSSGAPALQQPIDNCYSNEQLVIAAEIKALEEYQAQFLRETAERVEKLRNRVQALQGRLG